MHPCRVRVHRGLKLTLLNDEAGAAAIRAEVSFLVHDVTPLLGEHFIAAGVSTTAHGRYPFSHSNLVEGLVRRSDNGALPAH